MPDRTADQMRAIIARGASVMLNSGGVVATHAELPSAASLAIASGVASDRERAKAQAKVDAEKATADLKAIEAAEHAEKLAADKVKAEEDRAKAQAEAEAKKKADEDAAKAKADAEAKAKAQGK